VALTDFLDAAPDVGTGSAGTEEEGPVVSAFESEEAGAVVSAMVSGAALEWMPERSVFSCALPQPADVRAKEKAIAVIRTVCVSPEKVLDWDMAASLQILAYRYDCYQYTLRMLTIC